MRLASVVSLSVVAVLGCLCLSGSAGADDTPAFPSDPNAWINSGPLSVNGLKGKGIVLWFFEEDCPRCRARWPEMVETSKGYDGQAVVFIAVNSGNPRAKTEGYVRQQKIPWPVLVDTTRDFERACGMIQEISLQNISQIRYITPDGQMHVGVTDDLEEAADKAAEGATWKIPPDTIPESLKPVWMAVEIGNYKGIGPALKKSAGSGNPGVKAAAEKLTQIVQQEIDDQMARIKEAQDASNTYKAFELVTEMSDRFLGFELPKDAATLKKDLSKDPKVKAGQLAAKGMDIARKQLAAGNPTLKAKARAALEKIVSEYPDTTLARQAQELMEYTE